MKNLLLILGVAALFLAVGPTRFVAAQEKRSLDVHLSEDIVDLRISAPITKINLYVKISDANGNTYEKEVTSDGQCETENSSSLVQKVTCNLSD